MDGRYPPGAFVSCIDCTETAKEHEFNQWYNEFFIPSIESLGFVRNTKRFENALSESPTFRGRPKYLAISEVYRNDLEKALKEIRHHYAELEAQGKGFTAMLAKVNTLYKRIGPELRTERTGQPVTGVFFVLCYNVDPAREDEFNDWYNKRHSPEGLALGLYDTAYRYKVVDPNDPVPHQIPYVSLYETSINPLEAHKKLMDFTYKKGSIWFQDPLWVNLLGVHWSGPFRQIYPPR